MSFSIHNSQPPSYDSLYPRQESKAKPNFDSLEKKTTPASPLLRRVSLRDIGGRDVIVRGVPANELPPNGYEVSFDRSSQARNNPQVDVVGDSLKVRGPATQSSMSFSGINVRGGGSFVTVGNMSISGGGSGVFINGVPLHQLQRASSNQPRPEQLSPINIRVPEDSSVKSTNCRVVSLDNFQGPVKVSQSASASFSGSNLAAIRIESSGASSAMVIKATSLDASLSGASKITASEVSVSSKIDVSGASKVNLHDIRGSLETRVNGASKVTAQGAFSLIDVKATGASSVDLHGTSHVTPEASSSGGATIRMNGRSLTHAQDSRNTGYSTVTINGNSVTFGGNQNFRRFDSSSFNNFFR